MATARKKTAAKTKRKTAAKTKAETKSTAKRKTAAKAKTAAQRKTTVKKTAPKKAAAKTKSRAAGATSRTAAKKKTAPKAKAKARTATKAQTKAASAAKAKTKLKSKTATKSRAKTAARKAPTRKAPTRKAPTRKTTARKTTARKTTARKATVRKTTARKTTTPKTTTRKTAARKSPARKTAVRKTTARKTTARKTAAGKSAARKAPARQTTTVRKTTAPKAVTRKTVTRKTVARKTPARKTPARKTQARKSPAQKTTVRRTPVRETPVRETPVRKAPAARTAVKSAAKSAASSAPKPAPTRSTSGSDSKTVVLFPEAAFGPALNCVGIAQALRDMGHKPVFVCDKGFKGVFDKYGFPEYTVDMSGGMSDEEVAKFWANFIAGHLPHFRLSPLEQLPTYVVPVWDAIVESAMLAEEGLKTQLAEIRPDVVCVDNVILFPAIKRTGKPWVRIISCSENEIPDPDIPPHLSGCHENDRDCFKTFEEAFLRQIKPTHDRFNAFLARVGHEPYPLGQFFEASPYMNLLLYPKELRFKRRHPLDPERFQYLEGCVRDEGRYEVPQFARNNDKPLIYVSFGSLGAADVDLYRRMIALFDRLPYRFLMNVGDYRSQYGYVPDNVRLESWFPQPAVLPHVDLFIHHGGNNSFNEALYFGKPALIMPFCWDGLDNAARIHDTGYGAKLPRYRWTDDELTGTIARLLNDTALHERLAQISRSMQAAKGTQKAARIIADIASARSAATG